ncbi:hypothetical protein RvY_01217 [Ramazzottius varieornatus]|uniref:Uncharacterized protein n=1 Tax=Ramazzottius varieornatus TaxID=947166 RepID=A0A1D1UFI3_RAMVA|nr:hypothetical protein RvY_01217 [Ramazzottius varieornatus]
MDRIGERWKPRKDSKAIDRLTLASSAPPLHSLYTPRVLDIIVYAGCTRLPCTGPDITQGPLLYGTALTAPPSIIMPFIWKDSSHRSGMN